VQGDSLSTVRAVSGDHGRLDPAGEVVARAGVVARAAGRASICGDDIEMVLIDACAALVRGLGVEPDAWRELTLRYLSDPHPAAATGEGLDATAKQLMHAAQQEATRAGHGALVVLPIGRRERASWRERDLRCGNALTRVRGSSGTLKVR